MPGFRRPDVPGDASDDEVDALGLPEGGLMLDLPEVSTLRLQG